MFYYLEDTVRGPTMKHLEFRYVECRYCGRYPVERIDYMRAIVERPRDLAPIMWTNSGLIVSDQFLHRANKAGITGWQPHPVAVFVELRGDRQRRKYIEMVVTGKGGSIGHNEGVRLKRECPGCHARLWLSPTNGIHVDESQWDGSDIFLVAEQFVYLVSQRFADFMGRNRFRGVKCLPSTEWVNPFAGMKCEE